MVLEYLPRSISLSLSSPLSSSFKTSGNSGGGKPSGGVEQVVVVGVMTCAVGFSPAGD